MFSNPDDALSGLEIKGTGELDQYGPVTEFRIQLVANVPKDDKEIISRPINIVQPEMNPLDLLQAVVLQNRSGDETCAEGIVDAQVDDMTVKLPLRQLDILEIIVQIHDQSRGGFPLRPEKPSRPVSLRNSLPGRHSGPSPPAGGKDRPCR